MTATDAQDLRAFDQFGREIHVGDAVFATVPYDFRQVKSFHPVTDRGEVLVLVMLERWPEPALPRSLEVITGEDDFHDARWNDRKTFCRFDPYVEWEKFQQRHERDSMES